MVIRVPGPRSTQAGSYAALDDRMLVLDFQAGHIEAFVEIHHRYDALARHVCGRFLRNQQDVEEAVQDTWIRVFQGLHRFNGRYALQPWISRIATNVSLDLLRARARRPQLDDEPIDEHEREDQADGPEEEVVKLIERDLVIGVLAGLPDTHRRALVLRELEGRSHKEIGDELEITPAQAKALIHRAKGTFRREWLRAATERHGLAGIFLLPVLWVANLGNVFRRLVDRAGEVAHAGGTEVLTQAAQAASTPIVPVAATSLGEKIVAAGVTLVVAGGLTVGAATIARDRSNDRPEVVVAAPVASPTDGRVPDEVVAVDEKVEKVRTRPWAEGTDDRSDEEVVPPVAEEPLPSPGAEPPPADEPSPATEPSASPTPSPTPFVPPAWSLTFVANTSTAEACGCGPAHLISSTVTGTPAEGVSFAQVVRGAAIDGDGDAAWGLLLEFWGDAGEDAGRIGVQFTLSGTQGNTRYEGSGTLVERTQGPSGETLFRFGGPYRLGEELTEHARMPGQGELSVTLSFAPDGTLYLAEFRLFEAG